MIAKHEEESLAILQKMKEEHDKKALAILQQLKGMSIAEAQKLLRWCSDYLLNQPVGEWTPKSKDKERETNGYTN